MKIARAIAYTNIALVKYWGKRISEVANKGLNLPAVGSLSLTIDQLRTETLVRPASSKDTFVLNGQTITGPAFDKTFMHVERIWQRTGPTNPRPPCHVDSINHLPTAAGLASSASGFAALTLAAAAAFELHEDRQTLSSLARLGSGSAARSLWGGFVRLNRGEKSDGSDCIARPLESQTPSWDIRMLIVYTTQKAKSISSTAGMERSRLTSPYYSAWVETSTADLDAAERAINARDLAVLGEIMEHSCFKMHACMLASKPPLLYWNASTLLVLQELWQARHEGLLGFATIDAGPHVKILCATPMASELKSRIASIAGIQGVDIVAPGPDPQVEVME